MYDRRQGKREDGLAISVRGLSLWLLVALAVSWIAGATALFRFWQRDSYSMRTYSDALFFPLRRAEILEKNGQALLARGLDAVRQKNWTEAVALLSRGLMLHPRAWHARLTLAQIYLASNQRQRAMRLMEEGLTNGIPGRAYLTVLFAIAEQGEDYALVVQTARRYLPALQGEAMRSDRHWLAARELAALLAARQFDELLARVDWAERQGVNPEHRVLALLELQRPADALRILDDWRASSDTTPALVARLSARAFREMGHFDAMERALGEVRALAPTDPRGLVYGVVQQARTGREPRAMAALEDYLFRFGASAENLKLVAEPLAEIGNLPLVERCAAAASERGYPAHPFQLLLVHAQVRGGAWNAAASTLAAMKPASGPGAAQEQVWRDWMVRLLDAVQPTGEAAGLNLLEFLRRRTWPIKILQMTVDALRRAQQLETAREVLGFMRLMFPASLWVTAQENEVAKEIGARPPAPAATVATVSVPAAKVYFRQLDEAVSGERWQAAGKLIREARLAQPEPRWLMSRDGELRLAEMKVAQALGERTVLRVQVALYLNGDAGRSAEVLKLAQTFLAKHDRDSALALVDAVIKRSPGNKAAGKLLSAWRPQPPQPK